jgi:hypothetical protein
MKIQEKTITIEGVIYPTCDKCNKVIAKKDLIECNVNMKFEVADMKINTYSEGVKAVPCYDMCNVVSSISYQCQKHTNNDTEVIKTIINSLSKHEKHNIYSYLHSVWGCRI